MRVSGPECNQDDFRTAGNNVGESEVWKPAGLTDAINDARDGFTNGIGMIADGAEWIGKNAKNTYKYISIVIESWFN